MPAKLQNIYLESEQTCALLIPRKSGCVTALFDSEYLPKIRKQSWSFSGGIIQSAKGVAFGKMISDSLGRHRRKEWNDDFTRDNYIGNVVSVGVRLILDKLRSWNTKFHKQSKNLSSDETISHKVLLTDGTIASIKVRNRDSFLVPHRATMHNGRLCLLKPDDGILKSLQQAMIDKLDLPVFSNYELVDPLDLVIEDELNFRGVGSRCTIKDTSIDGVMLMTIYTEALPPEFKEDGCVRILFDDTAMCDVIHHKWKIIDGLAMALHGVFDNNGAFLYTKLQLSRFLAECYSIEIGAYIMPAQETLTMLRINKQGDFKKMRNYYSKLHSTSSGLRVRSTQYKKSVERTYRKVNFAIGTTPDGLRCWDMRQSNLTTV